MSDIIVDAVLWLNEQRELFMVVEAVYRRGGQSVTLPVSLLKTDFRRVDFEANSILQRERDVVVNASRIVLGGSVVRPEVGDTLDIPTPGGSVVERYRVEAPAGEQCYRNSDNHGVALRIHTKKIGVV